MTNNVWRPNGRVARAISLTRVSRNPKFDSISHETQHEGNLRCIAELGATLYRHYEENLSGALYFAREETQLALADLEADRADYLIVYSMDRYGRSARWQQEILSRIEMAEKRVQFATFRLEYDERDNRLTPMSRQMFNTFGSSSEGERYAIRERTMRGARGKAERGIQVARGYFPFGYRIVRKIDVDRNEEPAGSEGTYRIVEEERPLVELIWERYIEMKSFRGLATWLNEEGYRTRAGALWTSATLYKIITNGVYKGEPAYGKTRRREDERRVDSGLNREYYVQVPQKEWITLEAPAIVTPEQWEEANRISREGQAQRSGRRTTTYPLTGLVYCPSCGKRMYSLKRRGKRRGADEHRFACGGSYRRTPVHELECDSGAFSGVPLTEIVVRAITEFLTHPEMAAAATAEFSKNQARKAQRRETAGQLARLRKEIETLRRREQAAAEMAIEARMNGGDSADYEAKRKQAQGRRDDLERQVEELAAAGQSTVLAMPDYTATQAEGLDSLRDPSTPSEAKHESLEKLIESVYPVRPEAAGTQTEAGRNYATAGVDVILRTARPGPYFVLRCLVTKRGREAQILDTKTTLSIRSDHPYRSRQTPGVQD